MGISGLSTILLLTFPRVYTNFAAVAAVETRIYLCDHRRHYFDMVLSFKLNCNLVSELIVIAEDVRPLLHRKIIYCLTFITVPPRGSIMDAWERFHCSSYE